MGSKRKNFYHSGPFYLTAVDWTNSQHRRTVAASLVQGTYSMEHDRQKKLQGHLALAPPWWEFFNFQRVKELYDEHDHSIFGAIFEFKGNDLRGKPPQYVVAFRGTITTLIKDILLDIQLIRNKLPQSTRVQRAMQAVQNMVSEAGPEKIWLAGHSLGSAIALVTGKNMAKMGSSIRTYLFNPPFASFPIELLKNEILKHRIRFPTSFLKAGVAVALNSQHERIQIDHSFNELSDWIPHLFVNPSDPICAEYIGYFDHRENMSEVGLRKIVRHATQNSLGSLIFCGTVKDSEPPHLIPSAYLIINVSPKLMQAHRIHQWWGAFKQTHGIHQRWGAFKQAHGIHQWWGAFKQAHGIHQWWEQNINCQVKLHQYK